MIFRLNSTLAQQAFGEVLDRALSGSDVIVERYGSPRVAIINYRRYEQLLDAERLLLRERLKAASLLISSRMAHLSDSAIDNLIEQVRQDVHDNSEAK